MHVLPRLRTVLVLLLLGLLLGGCEPTITVNPEIDLGSEADATKVEDLENQVARLSEEAARERTRADRLQAEIHQYEEQSVILSTEDGFTFRINTEAAWVLIVAIAGLTTFLVARMRYAAKARRAQDGPSPS